MVSCIVIVSTISSLGTRMLFLTFNDLRNLRSVQSICVDYDVRRTEGTVKSLMRFGASLRMLLSR